MIRYHKLFSYYVANYKILKFMIHIIYTYSYMRWVQVTPGVTLKSYIFFKPLDLNRSNSLKKTIINVNILIDLIYYSLFNTFYTYF